MRDGVEENSDQCNCPHGLPDTYEACHKIKVADGKVIPQAGLAKGGSTVISFFTEVDGYKIELIQRAEGGGAGLFTTSSATEKKKS